MITSRFIEHRINKAERIYRKCWNTIINIQTESGRVDGIQSIKEFQPDLAGAIFDLSNLYREIYQAKQSLINRKSKYKGNWFRQRIARFSKWSKALLEIVAIGKSIGDSFVLLFYRNDHKYLRQHLEHEKISLAPPGIGGIGEIGFIKNVQHLNGYLLLHHGITNILRLGDMSLYDGETHRIVGIAEIKTHSHEGNILNQTLFLSGPKSRLDIKQVTESNDCNEPTHASHSQKLGPEQQQRLNRQLKQISKSFPHLETVPDKNISISDLGFFSQFDEFLSNIQTKKPHFRNIGQGMVLFAMKCGSGSLYHKHFKTQPSDNSLDMSGLDQHINDIMINGRNDNRILVNSFYYDRTGSYNHRPGMTHLAWWPINVDIKRKIVFKDLCVMSIYNPAHLFQLMEQDGFSLVENESGFIIAKKTIGNQVVEITGINYFIDLILTGLFTEEAIVSIFRKTELEFVQNNDKSSAKIELDIVQLFGSPDA